MLSRSILFDGPPGAERSLYASLNIASSDACLWTDEAAFLEFGRNGAMIDVVEGDFRLSIDLILFDIDAEVLSDRIAQAAVDEIRIAMPDEASESPWVYMLWEKGAVRRVLMNQEDDLFVISQGL